MKKIIGVGRHLIANKALQYGSYYKRCPVYSYSARKRLWNWAKFYPLPQFREIDSFKPAGSNSCTIPCRIFTSQFLLPKGPLSCHRRFEI